MSPIDAPGQATALWDMVDGHSPRLYYTGRASLRHYGSRSSYAIGVLEYREGRWERRAEPVLRGSAPRMSVLEPLVVHDRGRYLMWFQANPHEIGPGELPEYELRVTESTEWAAFNVRRLLRGERPVVPSPFYLAVGQSRLTVLPRGTDGNEG